jgi:micrococcal nuclease
MVLSATHLFAQQRPSGIPSATRFVASSRGQVYYPVGCDAWHELSPGNLLFFQSAEEAEARGYRPTRNRQCREAADVSTLAPAGRRGERSPASADGAGGGQVAGVCVVGRIVDGDTLDCAGGLRIRLLLIDAPETAQSSYGLRAKLALEELAAVGDTVTVRLDVQARDQYGRLLAHLFRTDGTWVNRAMVRRGYAVPLVYPPNVWRVEEIRAAADSARAEEAGLWAEGGFRCLPRAFRRGECGG